MERPVAYVGAWGSVVYAVANGKSPGNEFYGSLSDRDKAKLLKLFQYIGDCGSINNKEKFKAIEGTDFFEFKSFQIRMPCYRKNRTFIITHGFRKKKDAINQQEIDRAKNIRRLDEG